MKHQLSAVPLDSKLTLSLPAMGQSFIMLYDFKLIQDHYDTLRPLRILSPSLAKSEFFFEFHSFCHGKRLLKDPLFIHLPGSLILDSFASRIKSLSADSANLHISNFNFKVITVPIIGEYYKMELEVECPNLGKMVE